MESLNRFLESTPQLSARLKAVLDRSGLKVVRSVTYLNCSIIGTKKARDILRVTRVALRNPRIRSFLLSQIPKLATTAMKIIREAKRTDKTWE